jgi:hypothetical protein
MELPVYKSKMGYIRDVATQSWSVKRYQQNSPLENRGQRTVVFTTVDNLAEMCYVLTVTTNAYLKLQNCHGSGGEFKRGKVTLTNPSDIELARRLNDCSNWGLLSHRMLCRTLKMTVSSQKDNKLKAIKGMVGCVQGIKAYRNSKGKLPPILNVGAGLR